MSSPPEVTWEPPGPGSWVADRSHGKPGATPVFRRLASHTARTYNDAFRELGAPASTIDMTFVNGQLYRRIVPLVGARFEGSKPPPAAAVRLLTRVHPAFRREERKAANSLATKPYLAAIDRWNMVERSEWIAENRAHQAIEPSALSDTELADHLERLDNTLVRGWYKHHRLHAYDLGPIGDLMAHAQRWGIDTVDTMRLLQGASPATVEGAVHARTIADALREAGIDPADVASLEEIRSVPGARKALDDYLDTFGWRLAGGYDIDTAVLCELPTAICGTVRAAARPAPDSSGELDALQQQLRQRAPDPALFDELVADARAGYGMRDDNGPLTSQWPMGLTRRAFLETGRRLVSNGRIDDETHVFEADIPELAAVLRGDAAPSSATLAARAAERMHQRELRGPDYLGAPPAEPDLSPLPPALRRMMELIVAAATLLEPDPDLVGQQLRGVGIGERSYTGRACVASDAEDAIGRLEPGDVLVTPFTSPSFNSVLPMAGAIVVQEGGLLSHAAVMARELELPAVIGCVDAMQVLVDGSQVEVDPAAGEVRPI